MSAESKTVRSTSWPLVGIGLILLLWLGYLLGQPNLIPSGLSGLAVGKHAPAIQAAGWVNGEPGDLTGKVLVVEAWSCYCLPCLKATQELVEVQQEFADQDQVVFLGLTSDPPDALPQIEAYLKKTGANWPNGYFAIETLLGLEAEYTPATWVIGTDGLIVWNDDSRESISEAIRNALAKSMD
ncbi:MAG: TlpA family protein disulfide reductase [Planctomycetaceae bacterium]|nr:TlpA family protein disulfide reductase [Planctomycetaceae bacterium]